MSSNNDRKTQRQDDGVATFWLFCVPLEYFNYKNVSSYPRPGAPSEYLTHFVEV